MNLKMKLMRTTSHIPVFKTKGAAGADLYADLYGMVNDKGEHLAPNGEFILMPGAIVKIPVGVAVELEPGYVMYVVGRSGNNLKGLEVLMGTIDEDYRGEIHVIVKNTTRAAITIYQSDRIAQATIHKVENIASGITLEVVDELTPTERGEAGFGHTGI